MYTQLIPQWEIKAHGGGGGVRLDRRGSKLFQHFRNDNRNINGPILVAVSFVPFRSAAHFFLLKKKERRKKKKKKQIIIERKRIERVDAPASEWWASPSQPKWHNLSAHVYDGAGGSFFLKKKYKKATHFQVVEWVTLTLHNKRTRL